VNAGDVFNVVLVVALLAWVLYRQTVARPVGIRSLWVLPGILIIIGVSGLSHVDNGHLSATAWRYLTVDLVTSVALGALRGGFVQVFERNGVMWRQGNKITIALWVVAIAVRLLIGVFASHAGVGKVSDTALEAAFGLSLLGQNAVVALRGSQMGLPFAPSASRPAGQRGGRRRDGGSFS
jgi:hypothetical protein